MVHISSISLHSAEEKTQLSQMPVIPQRPAATLEAFAASKPPGSTFSLFPHAHIPYSGHSLSFLLPLSSSSFFFYLSFYLHPCSLIRLFPLSGDCTMHINYSEAVSQFLQLIQSERGSALMGSCCTCYRLQHTLETSGGRRSRKDGGKEEKKQDGGSSGGSRGETEDERK
ncbi:hypothetical protein XENORESO_021090 [Xenotaenia resolanae]|uniref:Uncharacterized protein n=1 Tax=Xenotaenia resolanae TaxID=208358 RepID=A0ABV0WFV0_9TELE